jgi:hypothetical protein
MKRIVSVVFIVAFMLVTFSAGTQAQSAKWIVGGNMLLSISTGGFGGTSAGFTFGPMAEVVFSKQYAIGTEFNINTQAGTPIEWSTYFKYYISVQGSKLKPYVDGGVNLMFVTLGPYFGIRFGGGLLFNVANHIYVGPDLQLGPIFATGSTIFFILIRGGFRYDIG